MTGLLSLACLLGTPTYLLADEIGPKQAIEKRAPSSLSGVETIPSQGPKTASVANEIQRKSISRTRNKTYIGFGIGGGPAQIRMGQEWGALSTFMCEHAQTRYGRSCDPDSAITLASYFEFGKTISPTTLLGLHLSSVTAFIDLDRIDGWTHEHTLATTQALALLTWFPSGDGFLIRGGMGPAFANEIVTQNNDGQTQETRDGTFGFGAMAGLGYAFWLGQRFNLLLTNDFHIDKYLGDESNCEPAFGWSNTTQLGFMWY